MSERVEEERRKEGVDVNVGQLGGMVKHLKSEVEGQERQRDRQRGILCHHYYNGPDSPMVNMRRRTKVTMRKQSIYPYVFRE
jgi:hypothetical protein